MQAYFGQFGQFGIIGFLLFVGFRSSSGLFDIFLLCARIYGVAQPAPISLVTYLMSV
jgi:hypothetical protein